MTPKDYYEILGVNRQDNPQTIKQAYRKLAMKYHPDRNPDDKVAEEKFKEAAEAYNVLSDPEKKSRYDQFGHAGVDAAGHGGPGFHNVSDIFDSFGDIFSSFFEGASGGDPFRRSRGFQSQRRPQRGQDFRYHLEVDLLSILKDSEQMVQFSYEDVCKKCNGTGAHEGTSLETCSQCQGQGQVHQKQGFFFVSTACGGCRGTGQMVKKKCKHCRGRGQSETHRHIKVKIPKGVSSGTQLRLSGEGGSGYRGGPPGDLYVEVFVKYDKDFERHGQDLVSHVEITYLQALLGATVKVKTLDQKTKEIKIPKGTTPKDILRLKGEGVPEIRGSKRGDLLLRIHIVWPKKLQRKEEKLLREIASVKGDNVS